MNLYVFILLIRDKISYMTQNNLFEIEFTLIVFDHGTSICQKLEKVAIFAFSTFFQKIFIVLIFFKGKEL